MLLDYIDNPADLKRLTTEQLNILSQEIRHLLIDKISKTGGHLGGNLGIVECTIALHYVFNSPIDKIVYDVSHQCYTHKILTGRKKNYTDKDKYYEISGYTNPKESEHDNFIVGHTSTSVSLASGLCKARDLLGEKYNVIAVIGDGSLSGGEALEGLDFAGEYSGNFIIVVNDNGMSIAENHGGLYKNLKELRESKGECANNIFKSFGLDYLFVDDGNDIEKLLSAFKSVKNTNKPIVVHICTEKGKGYRFAEDNKEGWHWHAPFCIEDGQSKHSNLNEYVEYTRDLLIDKVRNNDKIAIVCAGTPGAIGFTPEYRKALGRNFIDVGIAEEHAVAMISGMAKAGTKPIFCVQSSFLQRCYDQLSQDLALNESSAIILVYSSGIFLLKDVTHLGIFDISYTCNIPSLTCVSPSSFSELKNSIDNAIDSNCGPIIIRVPTVTFYSKYNTKIEYESKQYFVAERGSKIAILALGSLFTVGEELYELLKDKNVDATLINPLFADRVDDSLLKELLKDHYIFITMEDGIVEGGFGQKISAALSPFGVKVFCYGYKKQFIDRYDVKEKLIENKIDAKIIYSEIKKNI